MESYDTVRPKSPTHWKKWAMKQYLKQEIGYQYPVYQEQYTSDYITTDSIYGPAESPLSQCSSEEYSTQYKCPSEYLMLSNTVEPNTYRNDYYNDDGNGLACSYSPVKEMNALSLDEESSCDGSVFTPSTSKKKVKTRTSYQSRSFYEGLTEEEKRQRTRQLNNEASKLYRMRKKDKIKQLEEEERILLERNDELRREQDKMAKKKDKLLVSVKLLGLLPHK